MEKIDIGENLKETIMTAINSGAYEVKLEWEEKTKTVGEYSMGATLTNGVSYKNHKILVPNVKITKL